MVGLDLYKADTHHRPVLLKEGCLSVDLCRMSIKTHNSQQGECIITLTNLFPHISIKLTI